MYNNDINSSNKNNINNNNNNNNNETKAKRENIKQKDPIKREDKKTSHCSANKYFLKN